MKVPKHIIKAALISSPLLALFSMAPMTFVVFSINNKPVSSIDPDLGKITLALATITISIMLFWAINIYMFYYLKSAFQKRSWPTGLLYPLSYIEVWTWVFILRALLSDMRPEALHNVPNEGLFPFVGATMVNTLILILLNLFDARNKHSQLQLEKAQLEFSHLRAQHEQLKSHIEPHFLFNALNTLKILQKKSPELAQQYTIKLSKLLRRSISFQKNDLSLLREEVSFLRDYLELQKIRFRDSLDYQLYLSDDQLNTHKLPIFTLQILAENAIKHNSMSTKSPLILDISITSESTLVFKNDIRPKIQMPEGPGMGLKNLSERYDLLNVPPPEIDESGGVFKVFIKLL